MEEILPFYDYDEMQRKRVLLVDGSVWACEQSLSFQREAVRHMVFSVLFAQGFCFTCPS